MASTLKTPAQMQAQEKALQKQFNIINQDTTNTLPTRTPLFTDTHGAYNTDTSTYENDNAQVSRDFNFDAYTPAQRQKIMNNHNLIMQNSRETQGSDAPQNDAVSTAQKAVGSISGASTNLGKITTPASTFDVTKAMSATPWSSLTAAQKGIAAKYNMTDATSYNEAMSSGKLNETALKDLNSNGLLDNTKEAGFMDKWGSTIGNGIAALQTGFNIYAGVKELHLAKKQFNESKREWQANYDMQKKAYDENIKSKHETENAYANM